MNPHPDPTTCWALRCKHPLGKESRFYCPEHWSELIGDLTESVTVLYKEARSIYIGRSNYPERRLLEHLVDSERDYLVVLHWSGHPEEIALVEQELIKTIKGKLKCDNKGDESTGRVQGAWHCVYISMSFKDAARGLLRHIHKVNELGTARLAPGSRDFPPRPDFLMTELGQAAAAGIVGTKEERAVHYRGERRRW